jgi:hypothetical protein
LILASPPAAPRTCAITGLNGAMKPELKVTAKQFLKDVAFTFGAAFATGAVVGGVSFLVVRFFLA